MTFDGQRFECGSYISRATTMQAGRLFVQRKADKAAGGRRPAAGQSGSRTRRDDERHIREWLGGAVPGRAQREGERMPLRQEMETGRFKAQAEDGTAYVVVEFTSFVQMVTFAGPAGWVPGGKTYRLENGEAVNALAGGGYRIVATEVPIRRVD